MQRTYQYRLYPNAEQQAALETILCQSRLLYNKALAHRRDVYRHIQQSVSYVDQWNRFKQKRKARLENFGMDQALIPKLPDRLTDAQKRWKVQNLIQALRRSDQIVNQGTCT